MIGRRLGPYQITTEVARGGQATLYKAVHTVLGRETALKVLHPHLITVADFLQKFEAESKLLARLKHPNIVAVYDAGVDQGLYWIAMEWLDGQAVDDLIDQQEKLPVDLAVQIADQVAAALEYAHAQGLIHRDIKPGNMMLLPDGTVKVLDFGIAAIIAAGQKAVTRIGTVEYMSYEQFNGQADHRSDIYSLGASLYEMLTSQLPPRLALHPPTPPRQLNSAISPTLEQLMYRLLAQQPEDRPQTTAQFQQELEAALTGGAVVQSITPTVSCPHCGLGNRVGARYCRHCGAEMIAPPRVSIGKKLLLTSTEWLITKERDFTPRSTWSPSGHALAFTSKRTGDTSVQIADRFSASLRAVRVRSVAQKVADDAHVRWLEDGTSVVTISPQEAARVWSPDGKRCAFIHEDAIVVAEAESEYTVSKLHRKNGGAIIGWTMDGLWIVYEEFYQTDTAMYKTNLAGVRKFITGTPMSPYWLLSRDAIDLQANLIAFANTALYILDVTTGQTLLLESTETGQDLIMNPNITITHVRWSPEMAKILFVTGNFIWVVNTDDTGLQYLTEGYAPQWSPDGQHIAFLRSQEGVSELWVMRVKPA